MEPHGAARRQCSLRLHDGGAAAGHADHKPTKETIMMMTPSRRQFVAVTGAAAVTLALPAPFVQAQKRGGTLRLIPHADLRVLDVTRYTGYITNRTNGYLVYDTLFAMDGTGQVKPQMVDKWTTSKDGRKWTFTLRDGLKFHDGQPVTAEDCVVSLKRWSHRDPLGQFFMAATERLQATDTKTFGLELGKPFGLVLEALAKPSAVVPFILPARIAATPEEEMIKDAIGSGPYKFVKEEWQPGNQVVYVKNPDYVPRQEPPSGAAGGKRVYVDRLTWRYIPDAATAAAAIEAGEVDVWEQPPLDFVPKLEKNPNVAIVSYDTVGNQGWLRPNHLQPPFNNKKARQALVYMVDQQQYLQAAIGQAKYYRQSGAYFISKSAYGSQAGAPAKPDFERARQLLKESGYDGAPIVVLDPTNIAMAHAVALVTGDLLKTIGCTVDVQAMDWGTLVARRAKKTPAAEGGWNILHTWWSAADLASPALNPGVAGVCDKAFFGWYCSETMEKMRADWVAQPDPAKRKQLAEDIQRLAYDEVPYVPWGEFVTPAALRKNVHGMLPFPAPLLWNISIDA
jgi:peptide/nickel transport system substrate-binding protein